MSNLRGRNCELFISVVAVIFVLAPSTGGQSYLLTLSQNQRNYFNENHQREPIFSNPTFSTISNQTDTSNIYVESKEEFEDTNNKTIIVIKSIREQPNELSQTAMDIITIVWYVATFLALAAFFLLMACSDRRCNDSQRNARASNSAENPIPPPTPSPSYSEFAPPSYESVIKMQNAAKPSIFVIPFSPLDGNDKDGTAITNNNSGHINSTGINANNSNSNVTISATTPQTPTTPVINFYTINELQKLGS